MLDLFTVALRCNVLLTDKSLRLAELLVTEEPDELSIRAEHTPMLIALSTCATPRNNSRSGRQPQRAEAAADSSDS
jgi:hypothetical protein